MNKFDPNKPVQTRDGRKARIICTDAGKKNAPIIAIIYSHYGDYEGVYAFTEAGKFNGAEQNAQYGTHLVNIPEETKEYYKIFDDGSAGRRKSSKEQLLSEFKDSILGIALLEITKVDGVITKSEVVYAR